MVDLIDLTPPEGGGDPATVSPETVPVAGSSPVASVNGRTGNVVLTAQDVGGQDVITVADAAARKLAGTYAAGELITGVTKVVQTDLPFVVWFYINGDVTADASWFGVPYTTSEDGDIIVSMELANVTGTVPDLNVLGVSGGIPSIGDGVTSGGRKVMMNTKPAGYATMTSVRTTAVSLTVKQSGASGVCYSINGGTPTYVAGAVGASISLASIVDPDGSPTDIAVWPATSATSGRVGDLTYLFCPDNNLTTLDVSGLTALTELRCPRNSLTTLDVSGLIALTTLYCDTNSLTTLDVSGLAALTELRCHINNLTTLDVSGLTALTTLYCPDNNLTSLDVSGLIALTTLYCPDNNLTSLDVSGLIALTNLSCSDNNLTTLDVSGLTALTRLTCDTNSIASLRAVNVVLSYTFWGAGSNISNNNLDAAALDQFYTDLGVDVGATGVINVAGNPGTTGDDPTIATAKGYTITGS